MKTLYICIGLPRSGKTTYAKSTGLPIVCPDAVRLALHGERFIARAEPMVWASVKIMIAALFEAGHESIILDATNVTKKRRDEFIDKRWTRKFQVIDTPFEECLRRAEEEDDAVIIPVIERMHSEYEPPSTDELQEWEK